MSEFQETRLARLEAELQRFKTASGTGETFVLGIAGLLAAVLYIAIVANLPLSETSDGGTKVLVGIGSAFAGLFVFGGAIAFAKFAMRAVVELAVVALALGNALAGVLVFTIYDTLAAYVTTLDVVEPDGVLIAVLAAVALAVFLIDMCCIFVLYPLAKTSGSSSLENF